jgi:hypothetical protein
VHESDEFWKENAIRLNEKDHEQLKYDFSYPHNPLLIVVNQETRRCAEGIRRPHRIGGGGT